MMPAGLGQARNGLMSVTGTRIAGNPHHAAFKAFFSRQLRASRTSNPLAISQKDTWIACWLMA